jgi:radical SAM protein with 4Fe4S-binding SPASM domain
MLSAEQAERLGSIPFGMFQVSVDGPRDYHDRIRGVGTFERVVDTVELLRGHGVRCCLGASLTEATAEVFHTMVEVAEGIGAASISVIVPLSAGRARAGKGGGLGRGGDAMKLKGALDRFYEHYVHSKTRIELSRSSLVPVALIPEAVLEGREPRDFMMCSFPNSIGIDASGWVAPCDGLLGVPEYVAGNVRSSSLRELWGGEMLVALRGMRVEELEGVCGMCKWRSQCAGGCRAAAIIELGSARAPDPVCQLMYDAGLFPRSSIGAAVERD